MLGEAVDTLSTLHSFWRYGVLIAGVIGLVGSIAAWMGSLPPRETARRAGLIYVIALDAQVLIGIVLWLGKGGMALPPPFRLEHPLTMILAAVVAHVGQVMSRRSKAPKGAARAVAIAIVVSFVLVLLGIPGFIR
jgi:hypothetical protein